MDGVMKKKISIILIGIFAGAVLIIRKGDISWLQDEIFAIFVSLMFVTPVIDIIFEYKIPKEYIVVFVFGSILFICYSYFVYNFDTVKIIELGFLTVLFTAVGSIAAWFVRWLEAVTPPNQ